MFQWLYRLSDQLFIAGGPCEMTAGAGQAVVTLPRNPKPRTERYDGAGGIRPATEQEVGDYDAAQLLARSTASFDNEKLVKALAVWTAGKLNVPLNTAKQEILVIYRSL